MGNNFSTIGEVPVQCMYLYDTVKTYVYYKEFDYEVKSAWSSPVVGVQKNDPLLRFPTGLCKLSESVLDQSRVYYQVYMHKDFQRFTEETLEDARDK